MKKKLSALLISSVIAVSFAGCQPSEPSNTSSANSENQGSVSSSLQNSESSTDEEISYIMEYVVSPVSLSTEKMDSKSLDLSSPVAFTITSSEELENFYNKNKDTYCLDVVESGPTFSDRVNSLEENYFDEGDIIIVIQKYSPESEIEFFDIGTQGNRLIINTQFKKPSSGKTAYACSLIQITKAERKNAAPVINTFEPTEEESIVSTVNVVEKNTASDTSISSDTDTSAESTN